MTHTTSLREENDKLVKEKDRITQEHIQESYLTNLNLHRWTTELERALHKAEALLRERTQQVRELEDVPKIPVSPDEQLETEHRIVMEASSNMVDLALETTNPLASKIFPLYPPHPSNVFFSGRPLFGGSNQDLPTPHPPHCSQLPRMVQVYTGVRQFCHQ